MMRRTGANAAAVLLSFCLICAGCTTTRYLPAPSATTDSTALPKPGRKIIVTLKSGDTREFRLTGIESDALVGKEVRIPFAEIGRIQESRFSLAHTTGLVLGTLAVAIAAVLIKVFTLIDDAD
jgi:hypothetical protein